MKASDNSLFSKDKGGYPPLIIEKEMEASMEKIWLAITVPEQMKEWYFDLPGFKAEVGYAFEFYGGPPEKQYRHLCEVTEVLPGKRLQYSWRYDGYEGNSLVTFELFPLDEKVMVKLTHEGLESFPPIADLARENFVVGWTELIGELLVKYVTRK
jgi:uncharacterized protein YndB with AHSA1/START domain